MAQQFAAILGVGLAVFGLFFIASGEFGGGQPAEAMTLYENDFGQVGSSNEDFRNVDFGRITVGETRGNIPVYNREEITVSDKLLGGSSTTVQYNGTQPREGNVTFEVLGKQGNGKVKVSVNGETVFNEYMVATAERTVEIPEGVLTNGMNDIKISANRDGILGNVEYALEDFEVRVNDRKYHDYETSFRMFEYEIQDFDTATLEMTLPPGETTKNSPLEVYVNDNQVFSQRTVRGTQTVELTPANSGLEPGYNTIRFETESDSEYVLENAVLSVRYRGAVQLEEVEDSFALNQTELNYAQRGNTNETITFDYQNLLTTEPMNVTLNGNTFELNPETGQNTINIDSEDLTSQNQLEIISRNVYELNDFEIRSLNTEE